MDNFSLEFINQCLFRLEENPPRIEKCLRLLSEAEVWQKPNNSSNSIGNLILHLCGNIRQYAVSSLSGKADSRQRDEEFSNKGGYSKNELLAKFNQTLEEAKTVIRQLNKGEWLEIRSVQGFNFSGIGILIHVVEHLSYHTGQIASATKALKDKQLGFYAGFDLNDKNVGK